MMNVELAVWPQLTDSTRCRQAPRGTVAGCATRGHDALGRMQRLQRFGHVEGQTYSRAAAYIVDQSETDCVMHIGGIAPSRDLVSRRRRIAGAKRGDSNWTVSRGASRRSGGQASRAVREL